MAAKRAHTQGGIPEKTGQRLKECVTTNPVTIVVGKTGCGKSTKVPPFLLENVGGPILCTQPRRLAVVAVASRVAEEQGVTLGGHNVGYHVGQDNRSLADTRLVFTTAGILMEELRAHGVKALTKYKAVVLDECHERSPEQELCLAMCKLFLQKQKRQTKIRLVLMSATFDHQRYKNYFGSESPIDTITLETANMVDAMYERVETLYLEDVTRLLKEHNPQQGMQHSRFVQSMRIDPDAELKGEDGGKSLSLGLLNYLRSLVLYLDEAEAVDKVMMIFAPTYRHLEQIYDMLTAAHEVGSATTNNWRVGVLHSSMDMDDCFRIMQSPDDSEVPYRRILLASAIADSSVTIPGVSCVIDLCRALQVSWNPIKATNTPKTWWASQSICNQRQGRTGRTCPGRCFRLVSKGFFIGRLEPFDEPLLRNSSCRNETLKLLCSVSSTNSTTDPVQVMNQCLDPPPPEVIDDAFEYLQYIGACVAHGRSYMPTKMGDLLAALPMTVEDCQIVVAGAQLGLLHETLALRAIFSHKPAPIVHHFGDAAVNDANILTYYDQASVGTTESLLMANLSAYLYWDVTWNQYRARAAIEQFAVATGASACVPPEFQDFISIEVDASKPCCDVHRWSPALEEKHSQWCRARGINATSVRGIAELIDTALNVFYVAGLEPEWLRSTDPVPLWRRFGDWKGMQLNEYMQTRDVLAMVYDFPTGEHRLSKTLMALSADPRKALSEMTKEHILDVASLTSNAPLRHVNKLAPLPIACVHFLEGKCTFGSKCRKSHSPYAIRPVCKFYLTAEGCSRGAKCMFSHKDPGVALVNPESANLKRDPLSSLAPVIASLSLPGDIVDWFEKHHRTLFMLGDGKFEFTRSLQQLGVSPRYASDKEAASRKIGSTDVVALDATRAHLNYIVTNAVASSKIDSFCWNFPFTGDSDEHDENNESLILGTFHSLLEVFRKATAVRTLDQTKLTFAITLQGDQFSRWNILRSANRTGARLCAWGEFEPNTFPGYKPRRATGEVFPASDSRFYEFKFYANPITRL